MTQGTGGQTPPAKHGGSLEELSAELTQRAHSWKGSEYQALIKSLLQFSAQVSKVNLLYQHVELTLSLHVTESGGLFALATEHEKGSEGRTLSSGFLVASYSTDDAHAKEELARRANQYVDSLLETEWALADEKDGFAPELTAIQRGEKGR